MRGNVRRRRGSHGARGGTRLLCEGAFAVVAVVATAAAAAAAAAGHAPGKASRLAW